MPRETIIRPRLYSVIYGPCIQKLEHLALHGVISLIHFHEVSSYPESRNKVKFQSCLRNFLGRQLQHYVSSLIPYFLNLQNLACITVQILHGPHILVSPV